MFHRFVFLGVLFLLGFGAKAQQYPVKVNPVLTPPYELRLANYATSTEDKMRVQLLLTDLMEPSHQVNLRFSLENGFSSTVIAASPSDFNGLSPFTLYPGDPLLLSNIDLRPLFELQNLSGISLEQYAKPLPQGMYNFCFTAYDAINGRQLSQKSCFPVYLQKYAPPYLILPERREKIVKQNEIQNIVFQWMPRQAAPNTEYVFTLKEIWDTSIDPQMAFQTASPVWQETLRGLSLFYGMDKSILLPGHRYAWQVRAVSGNTTLNDFIDPEDNEGVYQNNGYSEIFYFDYVEDCKVPAMLSARNLEAGKTEIGWFMENIQGWSYYKVQYRLKGSEADWSEEEAFENRAILSDLENKTEYEYRVGAMCGQIAGNDAYDIFGEDASTFAYSSIQYFTSQDEESEENSDIQCGLAPDVNLANKEPYDGTLDEKDSFKAGDFTVKITQVSGSNGSFKGEGYIEIPYLKFLKVKVTFKEVKLNTDKQLLSGDVETTYDPTGSNIITPSVVAAEVFGQDVGYRQVDYEIQSIEIDTTGGKQSIIIHAVGAEATGGEGVMSGREELAFGKDYSITDSSGQVWTVSEDGTVTHSGEVAKSGAPTADNTEGIAGRGKTASVTEYTQERVTLEWQPGKDTKYAYDDADYLRDNSPKKLTDHYKKVGDAYVPYKAVVEDQEEYFYARVRFADEELAQREVQFQLLENGLLVKSEITDGSATGTDRTYRLTLKGSFSTAEQDLVALLMPEKTEEDKDESPVKSEVIGSLKLYHFKPQTIDLHLVPLDKAVTAGQIRDIKEGIEKTYAKLGVAFNIITEEFFDVSDLIAEGATMDTKPRYADRLNTYSNTQYEINQKYAEERAKGDSLNHRALFLTTRSPSQGNGGYWRLDETAFGYLFNNGLDGLTAAHEVGHGVFQLQHPDEEFSTSENTGMLMEQDATSDRIPKAQWKQINHPSKLQFKFFQRQREGEAVRVGDGVAPYKWFMEDETICFLSPGKTIVKFDINIWEVVFNWGINDYEPLLTASGFLHEFTYKENGTAIRYKAVIENGNFMGYKNKEGKWFEDYKVPNEEDKVVLVLPYAGGGRAYGISNMQLKYQGSGQSSKPLFTLKNYDNITLDGEWSVLNEYALNKNLFVPESISYLTLDGLSVLNRLREDDFSKSYLTYTKIAELRSSYPDLYKRMSSFEFNSWSQIKAYTKETLDGFTIALQLLVNPAGYFINNRLKNDGREIGYFDAYYIKNKYYDLNDAELSHKFLIHFEELIEVNKIKNQETAEAIVNSCINDYQWSEESLFASATEIRNAVDAMPINVLAEICVESRAYLMGILLNPKLLKDKTFFANDSFENAVYKLFTTTPKKDWRSLLETVANKTWENELIIKTIVDAVDDTTLFIGKDFNTKIMNWLISAYADYPHEFLDISHEDVLENLDRYQEHIISYDYENIYKRIGKIALGSTVPAANAYRAFREGLAANMTGVTINSTSKKLEIKNYTSLYGITTEAVFKEFNLLDPIYIINDSGLIDVYSENSSIFFIPAFTLYFIERKADAKTTVDSVQLTIDAIGLVIPGGQATVLLRALNYANRISSMTSIMSGLTEEDYPELSIALGYTSGILGVADFSVNGIRALKNLGNKPTVGQSAKFLSKNASDFTPAKQQEELNKLCDLILAKKVEKKLEDSYKSTAALEHYINTIENAKEQLGSTLSASLKKKTEDALNLLKGKRINASHGIAIPIIAKHSREAIDKLEGFADRLPSILRREGLTMDDFRYMMQKNVNALTKNEKAILSKIRNELPVPNENTLIQKVITEDVLQKYLEGDYSNIRGSVATAGDTKHLVTFEDYYHGLRLDYKNTKGKYEFFVEDGSCAVMRFKSNQVSSKISIPKGGSFDEWNYPFTSTGFTSGNNGRLGVPEWYLSDIKIPENTQIWRISNDGTEKLIVVFDNNLGKFIKVE